MEDLIIDENEGIIFEDDSTDGSCKVFIREYLFKLHQSGVVKLHEWLTKKIILDGAKLADKIY